MEKIQRLPWHGEGIGFVKHSLLGFQRRSPARHMVGSELLADLRRAAQMTAEKVEPFKPVRGQLFPVVDS